VGSARLIDGDIAPLIRKVGATSIAEIEKLIGELQATKNFLQSEADRIERETARYMNLTQMASASVKIIFDTVSGWRQAGHPVREFEIMPAYLSGRVHRAVPSECERSRCQRSTLSSTISARNLPCSAVMRPTVMGRRKRRGPALPGLKKSVPFFVSILGWCE
jgi:hypothetical protein